MSVSVNTIYAQVCFVLMEDGGLVLGLISPQQFLDMLGVVILDFAQRASVYQKVFTETVNAGVSQYTVPDDVIKAETCFIGGRLIEKVTEHDLACSFVNWRRKYDTPRQWHEDNLLPKIIEIFPNPISNGVNYPGFTQQPIGKYGDFFAADQNLSMVGAAGPTITAWTFLDQSSNPVLLQTVPDSFSHYIVYGILEQIFSADGETRDLQRALYCRTRWQEGLMLADAIAHEELLEDD
jgi:hypothetical protein